MVRKQTPEITVVTTVIADSAPVMKADLGNNARKAANASGARKANQAIAAGFWYAINCERVVSSSTGKKSATTERAIPESTTIRGKMGFLPEYSIFFERNLVIFNFSVEGTFRLTLFFCEISDFHIHSMSMKRLSLCFR